MEIATSLIGAERIDDLRELWLALHRHHRDVSELQPLVEDDELSWQRRRDQYIAWLEAGEAFVVLAEDAGLPVGYATVHLQQGPDDTWPVGEQWAEIYSLSVAPGSRRRGVGRSLLDAVDVELRRRAIVDVAVAVQVGNDDARRLYERRGFRPGEVVLYRFGRAADGGEDRGARR
jgi:ribosomal protein S18 acetylase RimI-like enzyme